MGALKMLKFVGEISQLDEFRDDLLRELNAFQELYVSQIATDVRRIMPEEIDKVMNIIRENNHGYVGILGKCSKEDEGKIIKMTKVDIKFFQRKKKIGIKAYLHIFKELCANHDIFFLKRKSFKDIYEDIDIWEIVEEIIGTHKITKIGDYLSYRRKREELIKAAKSGINVDTLKKNIKKNHLRIRFVKFEKPCFLLVGTTVNRILYTPFGKFEIKGFTKDAKEAFCTITGARRVPYGKDAMKKIEAMLLQASL